MNKEMKQSRRIEDPIDKEDSQKEKQAIKMKMIKV